MKYLDFDALKRAAVANDVKRRDPVFPGKKCGDLRDPVLPGIEHIDCLTRRQAGDHCSDIAHARVDDGDGTGGGPGANLPGLAPD
jgi:hypothetical protein